jgi:cytoskeletal protein CcmA (bactofilin family)
MDAVAQIGPSIRINGNITAKEPLTIAGEVTGSIDLSGHHLVVTEAGRVVADITAQSMIIGGVVNGRLIAAGAIVIRQTATVEGELAAASMSVDDGAQLRGRFEVTGGRVAAPLAS